MIDTKIDNYADYAQFLDSDTCDNILTLGSRPERTLTTQRLFCAEQIKINLDKTELLFIKLQSKTN